MARFTVRVQLHKKDGKHHDIDSEAYGILHAEMKEYGFTKTINSTKGIIHDLPTAEYSYISIGDVFDKYEILDFAKAAARITKEKFSILVTKSIEGRCWFNLDETEDNED